MVSLTKAERAARTQGVVAHLQAGKSYKDIEELEDIGKSSIGLIAQRLRERGNVDRKAGSAGAGEFASEDALRKSMPLSIKKSSNWH